MTLDLPLNFIEESKKIISIPSDPEHGTCALVESLAPLCHQTGFHLFLQPAINADARGDARKEMNLIAHTQPMGSDDLCPGGLVLVTHLDTVPAGDVSLWTETGGDPFCPTIKGDKIFGLGSADTKLDFLCKLKAIQNVGIENIKIPLALIGTFGEERALAGVRLLQESGIVHPQFALVSEPSEMQPVVKHKGILYLRVVFVGATPRGRPAQGSHGGLPLQVQTFRGRAAHGSMPHLGESAIEKAVTWLFEEQKKDPSLQLISIQGGTVHNVVPESCVVEVGHDSRECEKISFLKKFYQLLNSTKSYLKSHQNPEFDPPETTCNVGVIRTEKDRIEIEFDFRLIPETDGNVLFEILCRGEVCSPMRIEIIRSNAPMNTSLDSEIVKHVKQAFTNLGETPKFMVKSGNTEGAILSQMGIEAIVMGPGRSAGNIHAANEYNEISQLNKAVNFYTAFLKQFC